MNIKKKIKQLNFLLNKKDKQIRKLQQSKSDILDSGIDCTISYEDLKKQLEIANSILINFDEYSYENTKDSHYIYLEE